MSPFVARLDDHGENGMDLVRNIKQMYEGGDGHVYVLAASIRQLKHLLASFALRAELVTAPSKVWESAPLHLLPSRGQILSITESIRPIGR